MKIDVDLSRVPALINDKFKPLIGSKNRYIVLRGGRGSGKSIYAGQHLLLRVLRDWDIHPHRTAIFRRYSANLNRSVIASIKTLINQWGLKPLVKDYNKTEKVLTWLNGAQFLFLGQDDPEKIKSVHRLDAVFYEEATEGTLDNFLTTELSMRGQIPVPYQSILSFNPISKHNWVYPTFFAPDAAIKDALLHHSTFLDNKFLDEQYKQTLQTLVGRNENLKRVLIDGEWGSAEGVIYTDYETILEWPQVEGEIVYGVDFGFTHPTAVVKAAKYKDGYVFKEILYQSGLTNEALTNKIKPIIPRNAYIYCDSARPEAIKTMCDQGLNARPVTKGPDSVLAGIHHLQSKRLYITADSENLLKEISLYAWKKDRSGIPLDEPAKEYDDGMDAVRYAAQHFKINRGWNKLIY